MAHVCECVGSTRACMCVQCVVPGTKFSADRGYFYASSCFTREGLKEEVALDVDIGDGCNPDGQKHQGTGSVLGNGVQVMGQRAWEIRIVFEKVMNVLA